jgi:lipopolysaccharide/colanic/teichoic acid biosynthesis glycosyltransferase
VAPGLTGLAQVNGDYHSSAENKLRYDLAYIANASLWLDLSILLRTVKIILTTRGV